MSVNDLLIVMNNSLRYELVLLLNESILVLQSLHKGSLLIRDDIESCATYHRLARVVLLVVPCLLRGLLLLREADIALLVREELFAIWIHSLRVVSRVILASLLLFPVR